MRHDQNPRQRCRRRNCADRIRLRLRRAWHARREASAHGAALQLYAIFAVLLGSAPKIPAATTASRHTGHLDQANSTSDRLEPSYRPAPTLDVAMRDIRSAKLMTPRVKRAIAVIKAHAPEAADWIDDRAYWLEWSDIAKSMVGANDEAKKARMEEAATAWRMQKSELANTSTNGKTFKR